VVEQKGIQKPLGSVDAFDAVNGFIIWMKKVSMKNAIRL